MNYAYIRTCLVGAILLIPGIYDIQVTENHQSKKEHAMQTVEKNKKTVKDLYEKALNKRNLKLLQEFVSEDYVAINGKQGPAGFEETVIALIKAFPDVQWNIEELFGEDDKVFVRWKFEGTHTGQFQQFAATGQKVSNDGMGIYELKNEKITATRVYTDRLSFLQQLEVLPADLTSLSIGKPQKSQVHFIDEFFVPKSAEQEFLIRMNINRDFISKLPGFIEDTVYKNSDQNGNLLYLTIAVWENEQALNRAKEAVQDEYQRIGFNPAEFMERLDVKMERGTYREVFVDA